MLRRKAKRLLRRSGLPTQPEMWALVVLVSSLGGIFSAYVTSDQFFEKSIQSLARQYLYNSAGVGDSLVMRRGNKKDGYLFSLPYEKVESDGMVTRRGVFFGRAWPVEGRIEGATSEDFSLYGDEGKRSVTTNPDGTIRIRVEK